MLRSDEEQNEKPVMMSDRLQYSSTQTVYAYPAFRYSFKHTEEKSQAKSQRKQSQQKGQKDEAGAHRGFETSNASCDVRYVKGELRSVWL